MEATFNIKNDAFIKGTDDLFTQSLNGNRTGSLTKLAYIILCACFHTTFSNYLNHLAQVPIELMKMGQFLNHFFVDNYFWVYLSLLKAIRWTKIYCNAVA